MTNLDNKMPLLIMNVKWYFNVKKNIIKKIEHLFYFIYMLGLFFLLFFFLINKLRCSFLLSNFT